MPAVQISNELYFHLMRIAKQTNAKTGEDDLEPDGVAESLLWNAVTQRPDFHQPEMDMKDGIPF